MPSDVVNQIYVELRGISRDAGNLNMETAISRLARLQVVLSNRSATFGVVLREIEELWNALDHDISTSIFSSIIPVEWRSNCSVSHWIGKTQLQPFLPQEKRLNWELIALPWAITRLVFFICAAWEKLAFVLSGVSAGLRS